MKTTHIHTPHSLVEINHSAIAQDVYAEFQYIYGEGFDGGDYLERTQEVATMIQDVVETYYPHNTPQDKMEVLSNFIVLCSYKDEY